ncbi:MAG: tetratricopeptide repeat protein, partial [Micromonosporaceae bacterium]
MSDVGAQLDRAQILLDIGRVALARDLILKDLLQDPTNVRALCLLASCHHADEDYAAMLAVADRAVAADPDHEHGHRIRALALLTLGRGKDAELTALEAIRLAPGLWHGHALLAAA